MAMDDNPDFGTHTSVLPQARLTLSLLGPPQVMVNGRGVIGVETPKALALLAYLAMEAHRPQPRSALAALFWPDQPAKRALQNLRQALSRLRKAIEDRTPSGDREADPPHLLASPEAIQFNRQSDYWLDVEAFKDLLAHTQRHRHRRLEACLTCVSRLAQAVETYRGDLLAGLRPVDSLVFDEWLLIEREGLRRRACTALHALASSHLARGEPEAACRYARRLSRLDPWNEAAQQLLLRALMLSDGRNAALQHYQAFRQSLADELGVEPESETLALVEQIHAGDLADMQPHAPAAPSTGSGRALLPTPATPFVGREAERRQIADYLASQEQRLITLYGPGGSGKTRLALEIAAGQAPLWHDGVWFVPLAEAPAAEPALSLSKGPLVDALAAALDLQATGDPLEAAQLIDLLQPKELLLVLDSFEHLTAGASLLWDIVRRAPQVKILVTSRTRLGLQGEWAVELQGLEAPADTPATVAEAEVYSAVQLFVQNARRVAPDFVLSPQNLPHVLRICRLVGGLPLGIELAAAWVRLFRCRQIADEIERSPDFLHNNSRQNNSPERQHSLRATFEYSYNLLSEAERPLFRKLSVFRGGFMVEAARHIAGAGPSDLASLLDKSLLQTSPFDRKRSDAQGRPSRRLDVHLTLRDYAAEKLAESLQEEEEATRERHGRFYLAFLREREEALQGERQKEALDEIRLELGNVRAAWRWAAAQARLSEIDASMPGLAHFYMLTSLLQEGGIVLGSAADHLLAFAPEDSETRRVAGRLRLKQADFLLRRGPYPKLIQAAQAAIELAQTAQDAVSEAYGTFYWGAALWSQGEYEPARTQLERALSLLRAMGGDMTPEGAQRAAKVEGRCLNLLAGVCWSQGRHAEAKTYLERMLPLFTRLGDQISKAAALGNLGILASDQGDYAEAKTRYEQALHIHQEVGHPQGQSTGFVNLGELCLSLGAYAESEAHLQQALDINREIGARQREALVLAYLGLLSHYLGEDETAQEYSQQALELAQEVGDRPRQGMAWMMLGHALLGLGRLEDAAEAYHNSVALRRELDQPNLAMESLAGLARVALAQGDPMQAQAHVEEILSHLETGAPSTGSGHALDGATAPFQIYLTCCRVLKANHAPRAQEILATACGLLQERAAKITDEEMRRSFLENVAAHREIVSYYSERERA